VDFTRANSRVLPAAASDNKPISPSKGNSPAVRGNPSRLLPVAVVAVWLLTGPLFKFSDTWQLVINTGTTIVTFLMVFLIQRTQNKETQAIQLKLNELVAALKGASNRLIDLEDWTEEELWNLHQHYRRLAELARESQDTHRSLSVDSAEARHKSKHSGTDKSAA
jgi:low affinity Fe/Cu permease